MPKLLNYEFVAKRDHNRVRIPSKFKDIEVGSQVVFSVASNTPDMKLSDSMNSVVRKKRIITIQSNFIPDSVEIYVFIHKSFHPIERNIDRSFQQKITARGDVRIAKMIGGSIGDLVEGTIEKNISTGVDIHVDFSTKVKHDLTINLGSDFAYSPKDRIQLHIKKLTIIPENQKMTEEYKKGSVVMICGELGKTPIFTSTPISQQLEEHIQKIDLDGKKKIDIQHFENYAILSIAWKQDFKHNYFLLQLPSEMNIHIYLEELLEFHEQSIVSDYRKIWNHVLLKNIYNDLMKTIQLYSIHQSSTEINLTTFLPHDLVNRDKISHLEAEILSIMLSRLVDGKIYTSIREFSMLIQFEMQPVLEKLNQRGIIVKSEQDDDLTYSFPKFLIPRTLGEIKKQGSTVLITHSFGGGASKTTTTTNIARILADSGEQTILIDFDFINSRLKTIFSQFDIQSNGPYLNQYLNSECKIEQIIIPSGISKLDLILTDPSGNLEIKYPSEEKKLHYFRNLVSLLMSLRSQYKYILIDAEGSIDYNIINAFLLADVSLLLTNGNDSSLQGVKNRANLILKRTGINIRNDYLIQTLIPKTRIDKAKIRLDEWDREFSKMGIVTYPEPMLDEELVRESIFDNQYLVSNTSDLYAWITDFLRWIPRFDFK
ncbi:MAG: AAA family ATPase [Candidatus Heimdallarchaeota archaeon]|nr:AAA family ATPase [Candidatus Heimdallarchaeota archaeon]